MWKIDHRKRYSTDGLRDDIILSGNSTDFSDLSDFVTSVAEKMEHDTCSLPMQGAYRMDLEFTHANKKSDQITSPYLYGVDLEKSKIAISDRPLITLQNEEGAYYSMDEWNDRKILKIRGDRSGLLSLAEFFNNPLWAGDMNYAYLKTAQDYDGILHPNSCDVRVQVERD